MRKLRIFAIYFTAVCCMALSAAAQDVINTVVGAGPSGIPSANANLYNPYEVAVDSAGNVYVASSAQNRIFRMNTNGTITLVAGNGTASYSGDGGKATAAGLNNPWGVAVDAATPLPNVYIGDVSNCLVRKVDQNTGVITTIAGLVTVPSSGAPYPTCGYTGTGGKPIAAELYGPAGIAVNSSTGDVYISEFYNGVIRKIGGGNPNGTLTLVAGTGGTTAGENCAGSAPYGDTGAAGSAYLCYPQAVAIDTSTSPANVFISESSSGGHCDVREVVGSTDKIYQVAGSYTLGCGFTDNVNALSAQLYDPWQMHVSVSGGTTTVQVADYQNDRIRQFPLTYSSSVPKPGTITTIGGKGQGGFCNDAGPVLNACMGPVGLAYDSSGNYYIGDYGSDRVRKVTKSTTDINTIAGWGPNGGTEPYFSDPVGLKGVAGTPSLYYPVGVFADPSSSNVYVGGYEGDAVYLWNSSSNQISDFAGNGVFGFDGDGGAANNPATELAYPLGMAKDTHGNILIADNNNCAIREVEASNGNITTIAGGSSGALKGCGFSGDGGPAVNAQFSGPNSVAVDGSNDIFIADYNNCAIRKISGSTGDVSTIAGEPTVGCGFSGDGGPATAAKIYHPQGVSTDGAGNIYFADQANNRVREIVAATGYIQTIAGYYFGGYTGDGPATSNALNSPGFTYADPNGNVFFSDTNNQILRWVTPTGTMITFAGTPQSGAFSGDGGKALSAQFLYPQGVSRDSQGNTYVADEYNQRVRQITPFAGYGLSTAGMSFEIQPTGTTSNFQAIKLSAVGPTSIYSISIGTGFNEVDDCVGINLNAGQTCEIDVYFSPTSAGNYNSTMSISSNAFFALNPKVISLTGTGGGLSVAGSLAFPAQLINTKATSSVTITNHGPAQKFFGVSLDLPTSFAISGNSCPASGATLASGASCSVTVSFDPTTIGFKRDTLVVNTTDPSSPLLIPATGTGTEVEVSTTSISFGSIPDRNTTTSNVTVTNTGTSTLSITTAISGGGAGQFAVATTSANTCKSGVAAGKSCTLPVLFNPTFVGSITASLTLTTNGGTNPVIALSGTSTSDIKVSSGSISFATIKHGTNETTDLTITNLGTNTLSLSTSFSGSGAAEFSINSTGDTCGSSVAGGKSCTLPVKFAPAAAASYSATLTLNSNGGTNPTVALTGTGD